eukprot:616505_1
MEISQSYSTSNEAEINILDKQWDNAGGCVSINYTLSIEFNENIGEDYTSGLLLFNGKSASYCEWYYISMRRGSNPSNNRDWLRLSRGNAPNAQDEAILQEVELQFTFVEAQNYTLSVNACNGHSFIVSVDNLLHISHTDTDTNRYTTTNNEYSGYIGIYASTGLLTRAKYLSISGSPQTVTPLVASTSSNCVSLDPTKNPTKEPSPAPTNRPTQSTEDPTHGPTLHPTILTKDPTIPPTIQPSQPSHLPTNSPSTPSKIPTSFPSDQPSTHEPSTAPTNRPTMEPGRVIILLSTLTSDADGWSLRSGEDPQSRIITDPKCPGGSTCFRLNSDDEFYRYVDTTGYTDIHISYDIRTEQAGVNDACAFWWVVGTDCVTCGTWTAHSPHRNNLEPESIVHTSLPSEFDDAMSIGIDWWANIDDGGYCYLNNVIVSGMPQETLAPTGNPVIEPSQSPFELPTNDPSIAPSQLPSVYYQATIQLLNQVSRHLYHQVIHHHKIPQYIQSIQHHIQRGNQRRHPIESQRLIIV